MCLKQASKKGGKNRTAIAKQKHENIKQNIIYTESETAMRNRIENSAKNSAVHSFVAVHVQCTWLFLWASFCSRFFLFSSCDICLLFIFFSLFSFPISILFNECYDFFALSLSIIALCFWNKCSVLECTTEVNI